MAVRTYQPELGSDIQQGFSNLGALFGPPTAQSLVAQSTIANAQATQAAQAQARSNIQAGKGTAADFATLNVSDPEKQADIGSLFRQTQANPGAAPSSYDAPVYVLNGDAGKTFAGIQSQPMNDGQSRILPSGNAAQMGVPQTQHGVLSLGDSKALPGTGETPIVSAPDDNSAPDTTDGLAARVGWDAYQKARSQSQGTTPPSPAVGGTAGNSILPLLASGAAGATGLSGSPSQSPSPLISLLSQGSGSASDGAAPAANGGTGAPGATQDPVLQAIFGASINRLGKGAPPQSQTNIDMKGEGAEAAETGKMAANRENDLLTAADQAPEKISRLQLLSNVLEKTRTGPLAGPSGTAVAVANSLGIGPDKLAALGIDPNQAVNNETAQKLSNELVAGSIGAKGGGFPASNFSVAERQFIEKMFPSISSQPGSNQFVSDVLQAREQRTLQKAQDFATYRNAQQQAGKPSSFNDFDAGWQQQHATDNVFAPVISKFNAGGYSPAGAMPPQPGGAVSSSSIAVGPGGSSQNAAANASGPNPSAPPGTPGAAQPPRPTARPPLPGARQAADGKFYLPDPQRPGKFLQVGP